MGVPNKKSVFQGLFAIPQNFCLRHSPPPFATNLHNFTPLLPTHVYVEYAVCRWCMRQGGSNFFNSKQRQRPSQPFCVLPAEGNLTASLRKMWDEGGTESMLFLGHENNQPKLRGVPRVVNVNTSAQGQTLRKAREQAEIQRLQMISSGDRRHHRRGNCPELCP